MNEPAILNAVVTNPGDDALRAVYADWLDEHGEVDRAEYLRLQLAVRALSCGSPEQLQTLEQIRSLKYKLDANWITTVDPFREDEWRSWLKTVCEVGTIIAFCRKSNVQGTQGWGEVCEDMLLFYENGPFGGETVVPLWEVDRDSFAWWDYGRGWVAWPELPKC